MKNHITKSSYLTGLQCVKKLWLSLNDPGKGNIAGPVNDTLLKRGTMVGRYARDLFPGGVLVSDRPSSISEPLAETAEYMKGGAVTLFEPAFLFDDIFVRVDILRASGSGRWQLIEVKSTLDVQDIQLPDIAVQKYVLEGSGINCESASIMHLNRACRYPDLTNLFTSRQVDRLIEEEMKTIPRLSHAFREIIDNPEMPAVDIGDHCNEPYECRFKPYCWKQVPSPSIFNIRLYNREIRDQLIRQKIYGALDIPDDYTLPAGAKEQLQLHRKGLPVINREKIIRELDSLAWPLFFLDFETDNPPVPRYPGTGPYHQVPFQYSLHIVNRDGETAHHEYLHRDTSDPRRPLAEKLAEDIDGTGTVIAYFARFEKGVLTNLADLFSDLSGVLYDAADRLWDLLDIFKKYYKHPGFLGSNSLKSVLPVMVPEMSYDSLDVRNGQEAQTAWNRMIDESTPPDEKEDLAAGLLTYCGQDTWAMVEIYRKLREL